MHKPITLTYYDCRKCCVDWLGLAPAGIGSCVPCFCPFCGEEDAVFETGTKLKVIELYAIPRGWDVADTSVGEVSE